MFALLLFSGDSNQFYNDRNRTVKVAARDCLVPAFVQERKKKKRSNRKVINEMLPFHWEHWMKKRTISSSGQLCFASLSDTVWMLKAEISIIQH